MAAWKEPPGPTHWDPRVLELWRIKDQVPTESIQWRKICKIDQNSDRWYHSSLGFGCDVMIFATPPVFQEEALAEEGIGLLPPSQIRGGDCFHERPEESLISHLVPSGPIHSAAVSEADRRFVERTPFPGPVLLVAVWRKLSSHAMLQPLRQQVRYRFVWKWLERVQERVFVWCVLKSKV